MSNPQGSYDPYPAGKLEVPVAFSRETLAGSIQEIADLPGRLRAAVGTLNDADLDRKTLPGVWTIRQVVHHIADSHMNSFIRFKLTLTEDHPTVRPYNEGDWALTPDAVAAPVESSLGILEHLHARWVVLLRSFSDADFQRQYFHPESQKDFALGWAVALYGWHGRHHLAHIEAALRSFGI